MPSDRRARLLLGLLSAVVAGAAFLPTLRCGFLDWDDSRNILLNEHYRGFAWENLRWMFTSTVTGIYQPLSWLSLALDFEVWGMAPFGYHLTNVILHAVNAGLLFFVCAGSLSSREERPGWPLPVAALFGALFWALHPLRVESVAWVTERRDMLSTCFYLASVLAYLEWAGSGARRWLAASLGACALSLLAKPMGMTLPFALLILDAWPLRRPLAWRSRLIEKLPFLLMGAAAGVWAALSMQRGGFASPLSDLSTFDRTARAAWALVFYPVKTLWPSGLSPLYELPLPFDPWAPRLLASFVLAGGAAIALWRQRTRAPGLCAAAAFYVVSVMPVIGLFSVGIHLAADRYTYLPMLGFSVLAAAGMLALLERAKVARLAACLAATVLILLLGALSWRQCRYWRDSRSLWERVLAVAPNTALAYQNLGTLSAMEGDFPAALKDYRTAAILRPRWGLVRRAMARALYDQGNLSLGAGRLEEAARLYGGSLAQDPGNPEAFSNLGLVLERRGLLREARGRYGEALRLRPDFPEAHYNLANILARQGLFREAADQYRSALRADPAFPGAQERLALARRLGGL